MYKRCHTKTLQTALANNPKLVRKYQRPPPETDRLYRSEFIHPSGATSCSVGCPESNLIPRQPRSEDEDNPQIHYGLIASSNILIRDAITRDRLSTEHDILCFEMEAAGLMDHVTCGVIRGICDYSDSHKDRDRQWVGYAAMMAAAYAQELLLQIAPAKVRNRKMLADLLDDS
jgi:nucleoside phosphorylase